MALAELDQMAADARYMLSAALEALAARNPEISLRLKEYDDRVDSRYTRLFDEATRVMQSDAALVIPGTYILWVGQNIERIDDLGRARFARVRVGDARLAARVPQTVARRASLSR